MSEESEKLNETAPPEILSVRYSLKDMMDEVAVERRESVFGRELVDSSEIDKMFLKNRKRKKS